MIRLTAGLKTYHGEPCRKCGSTERRTSDKSCVQCRREADRRWRAENREKLREYRAANRGTLAARDAKYRAANKSRIAARDAAYYAANRETLAAYHAANRETPSGRASKLLAAARARAKASGIPVTITREWIEEKLKAGNCEATGVPFDLSPTGYGNKNPWAPSLDQITPGAGYTPENVQVVCWIFNVAKQQWDIGTLELFALALVHELGLLGGK